jgi:peptidoglycan/LPS O-acetylase OafA/YrhL
MSNNVQNRLEELDSLRGLAAMTVVAHHCLIMLPMIYFDDNLSPAVAARANVLKYTPLHALWAGHEAVLLFFVLSGFVLSLPFFSERPVCYRSFGVKRICRIYIPCIIAMLVGIALREMCVAPRITGGSPVLDGLWRAPVTPRLVAGCTLVAGTFNLADYNSVLWSLVHELRISIVMPFLALFVWKRHWGTAIACASLMYAGAYYVLVHSSYDMESLVVTASYIPMFLIGAVMAKHRNELVEGFRKMPLTVRLGVVAGAIACYTYPYISRMGGDRYPSKEPVATVGAAAIIVIALASGRLSAILKTRPLLFLGRISYSLYLYHFTVLLTLVHLLNGRWPLPLILGVAAATSIPVSALAYNLVEAPSIRWARRLSNLVTVRP